MASTLPYISREELDELENELRTTKPGWSPDLDAFHITILLDLIEAFRAGGLAQPNAAGEAVAPDPLNLPEIHGLIREAGGIVHGDGNIFFTNAERFIVAAVLCGDL